MRTKTVKLDDLRLDSKNARKHGERNIAVIKASLERFGQRLPLLVRDGVVVVGNGRFQVMRELGWKKASVIDMGDMSDEEARAYALVDNRSAELAEWDRDALAASMKALSNVVDLTTLGWETHDIDIPNVDIPDLAPAADDEERKPRDREGSPIRLTAGQRVKFDDVADVVRETHGDIRDGEIVSVLCDAFEKGLEP